MKTRSTQNRTAMHRSGLLAGAMLAGLVLAPAPALAQEGDFLRNIFGSIGLVSPDRPQIEYRERAPLVVPPARELPPPASADALREDPRWPTDASEREKRRREARQEYLRRGEERNRPLTSEEIRSGRITGAGIPREFRDTPSSDEAARPISRVEMGISHRDQTEEAQGLTRRYLTDPPADFLQPAPAD